MMSSHTKNHRCFAPGCKTGYSSCSEKLSLFKAPQNESDRIVWAQAIPRDDKCLSTKDVLCEKHFDISDIIRNLQVNDVSIF